MCPPVLAVAAIALTAVSAVSTANAQKAAAQAQSQQIIYTAQNEAAVADYNAQATENVTTFNEDVAEQNALIYEQAASDAIQRGADDAAAEREFSRRSNSRGRATAGSSGFQVDTGTNIDLLVQNRAIGEMNALTVMNNAEREAYGYKLDATAERNRAKGIRYTGDIEAEQIRLGAKVGLLNAEYGAANTRYAGRLESRSTLISGAASVARLGYGFYQDDIFARNASK